MLPAITAIIAAEENPNPLLPAVADLVWSSIVFVVILTFFLWKILPNMKKMLDARAAAIEGNIAKADEAQREAEAARITATAHAQIEAERQSALVSLRTEVGSLALDLAGQVIGEALNDDKKSKALVDRFLTDLEKSEKVKK